MTSIRKTKKALKREIRRLESQRDYKTFENPLDEYEALANAHAASWVLTLERAHLATLLLQCKWKSFHTKMMRVFRAMPESPKKEELRCKLIEIKKRHGEHKKN